MTMSARQEKAIEKLKSAVEARRLMSADSAGVAEADRNVEAAVDECELSGVPLGTVTLIKENPQSLLVPA
jgi:hypothetical protein